MTGLEHVLVFDTPAPAIARRSRCGRSFRHLADVAGPCDPSRPAWRWLGVLMLALGLLAGCATPGTIAPAPVWATKLTFEEQRAARRIELALMAEASCGSSASSATEGLLDQSPIGAQGRPPHNSLRLHHGLSGWRLGAETPVNLAFPLWPRRARCQTSLSFERKPEQ